MNISDYARIPYAPTYARRFMVSTTDQVASSVAFSVLHLGGNAADAAVAAASVLAVVAQHQCGMGGDAFALVHDSKGTVHALEAVGRAGSGADPDLAREQGLTRLPLRMDVRAATVPGAVDGWLELHQRFGTWDLADLLKPAIGIARDGFAASPTLVRDASAVTHIAANPEYGHLKAPGDVVKRPRIAAILEGLSRHGRRAFYEGSFGEGLLHLGAGEFVEEDLHTSNSSWMEPLSVNAFGKRIWTVPPVSQGYLVLTSASIVERLAVPADADDPLWAHLLVEAARFAGANREDELHEDSDGRRMLDESSLALKASRIDPNRRASFSEHVRQGDTNYFCVADGNGMAVSFIHSNAHGFGSHLVVPKTGIFLHNRGIGFTIDDGSPTEYRPGRKPPHTLAPLLVTDVDGTFRATLGTMGADSQPQVLLQLLHRLFVLEQDPATAIAAARWFLGGPGTEHEPFDTWFSPGGAAVQIEAHAPLEWKSGLQARGHVVRELEAFTFMAGYAQAIVNGDGHLMGASDPRALSGSTLGH